MISTTYFCKCVGKNFKAKKLKRQVFIWRPLTSSVWTKNFENEQIQKRNFIEPQLIMAVINY